MIVKTRFAPSPSGDLHIGNIRTALYAWLFARSQGGKFLLRIENTNLKGIMDRDSVSNILSIMTWLNLDWDEGPYFQTDRFERYNSIIDNMIKDNMAYRCYCSEERLTLLRSNQLKLGKKPKYDRHCRMMLCENNAIQDSSYVVRFCNPLAGQVTFYDEIRGFITFDNKELDDLIIRRANGIPTYNFCVVIDDMDMNITHVIRGEEHINNTPRQINILKALNASIPVYAHVPMILDSNRKKISKRYGMLGIIQYRKSGFLPEAVLNYLIRLGWSRGDQEIFSIDQMKQYFSLKDINKSSSIFNFEKLLWLNRYYLNHLPVDKVASYLSEYMNAQNIDYKNGPELFDAIKLFAKRSNTLKEIIDNCYFLYKDFNIFEKKIAEKYLTPDIISFLKILKDKLNYVSSWKLEFIKSSIQETINELRINMKTIGMPIRILLTGTNQSPELSIVMYVIGKHRVLNRINDAIFYIEKKYSIYSKSHGK